MLTQGVQIHFSRTCYCLNTHENRLHQNILSLWFWGDLHHFEFSISPQSLKTEKRRHQHQVFIPQTQRAYNRTCWDYTHVGMTPPSQGLVMRGLLALDERSPGGQEILFSVVWTSPNYFSRVCPSRTVTPTHPFTLARAWSPLIPS